LSEQVLCSVDDNLSLVTRNTIFYGVYWSITSGVATRFEI